MQWPYTYLVYIGFLPFQKIFVFKPDFVLVIGKGLLLNLMKFLANIYYRILYIIVDLLLFCLFIH
jgi:hypothetical protein